MARTLRPLDTPKFIWLFVILALVAFAAFGITLLAPVAGATAVVGLGIFLGIGLYCLLVALWMFLGSKVGKFRFAKRWIERLELQGEEAVLDASLHPGVYAPYFKGKVTAVGSDPALFVQSEGVHFQEGDVRALPFEAEQFDVVICGQILRTLSKEEEREKALGELVRVLKPGGRLLVFDQQINLEGAETSRLSFATFPPTRACLFSKPGGASTSGAS